MMVFYDFDFIQGSISCYGNLGLNIKKMLKPVLPILNAIPEWCVLNVGEEVEVFSYGDSFLKKLRMKVLDKGDLYSRIGG